MPRGNTKPNREMERLRKAAAKMVHFVPHTQSPDLTRLLYELEVHQVELVTQNEELRRAQLELADAHARYQKLFDLAPIAYVTFDVEARITEANLAASQLLRCELDRLIGTSLSNFLVPSDRKDFECFRADVLRTGIFHTHEFRFAIDGVRMVLRLDAVAVPNDSLTSCRCVLVDVSELRLAQELVRSQATHIQTMFDTAPDPIIGVDDHWRIERVNAATTRVFRYGVGQLVGEPLRRLLPSLGDTGVHEPCKLNGRRSDGSSLTLVVEVGEWQDGGQRRRTVILHDQTEQEEAARRERESEERLRQIAETINDVFYTREPDGRLSYASPAYERLMAEPVADVVARGEVGWGAIHPDDRERMTTCMERLLAGAGYDVELRLVRSDGAIRWVRDRAFPVRRDDGTLERIAGVVHDATVERELELQLRQAQKMEAIGSLAAGVAHDINNVLQIVSGVSELVAEGRLPLERLQTQMRRLRSATRRGADLVHRLMAFARKERITPKPLELDGAVADAAKLVRRLLTERIPVQLDLRAHGVWVRADTVQIEQILLNLATNARDAMPEGGTLTIETRELAGASGYVVLVIGDTGTGMDEATRARIFEPFFTTKEVGKGTGLGLASVYGVIRELGGDITVKSAPGEGTTFFLTLPCCEPAESRAAVGANDSIRLHGSVLLIDDDHGVRTTLRSFLEGIGLSVVEAESPEEALLLSDTVDVVVTDVVMPGILGPRLVDSIRKTRREVRALFVSAHPLDYLADAKLLDRAAPFLQKPFSKEQLAASLADVLGR